MKLKFPDGSSKDYNNSVTGLEIAKKISNSLAKKAVAVKLNNELIDLDKKIDKGGDFEIITIDSEQGLEILNHSTAHIMAAAVVKLFPRAKPTIGPSIENGFYYDFYVKQAFTQEDRDKIEKEMQRLIDSKLKFERVEMNKAEAILHYKGNKFKIELINELPGNKVSFYKTGQFTDLCKGPHIPNASYIKAFKLTKQSSAYWRADDKKESLQRLYGVAFPDKKKLKKYLEMLENAEKYNHVKLGKELDLFIISDVIGKGLPLFTPKGATIKRILRRFIEDEEIKRGYKYTETPVLTRTELYNISGHLEHYRDDMFVFNTKDGEMALRPMTCPHQFMIFKRKRWSYRELPVRYAELANLFRNEKSGELHGLIRVRQFDLADAHIFCRPDQLADEFKTVVDFIDYVMKVFGFKYEKDYWFRFSRRDAADKIKYIDNANAWDKTEALLKDILDNKLKIKYVEKKGEAAFYGPKLDVQMKNIHGKEDTLFTVQIDFAMPERFDMTYTDKDGKEVRPYIIHRSVLGAPVRVLAFLIEHYKGRFPVWLSPVQVKVLPINSRNDNYAESIMNKLESEGIRVEGNFNTDTIGKKIKQAQLEKVPYMLILGDKEEKSDKLSIRDLDGKQRLSINLKGFIKEVKDKIKNRSLN